MAMGLVPPLLFFSYFATQMAVGAALLATAGAWVPLVGTGITENDFYRRSMGLDSVAAHALLTLLTFTGFIAFVAATIAVSWTSADVSRRSRIRLAVRIVLLAGAVLVLSRGAFPRALPLVAIATLVAVVILFARARVDREQAIRLMPLVLWSPFALVLLAKLGVNARVVHYGFYLAMPAMVAAIALVIWLIPHVLASWRSAAVARSFRQVAPWMLAAAMAPYLERAHEWNRTKTVEIGSGADGFYAPDTNARWEGRAVREALRALEQAAPPGATLAVLPEGVMLNYLLRLDSPLRIINLMPPEVMAFGEDDVLRSLATEPPDFVVLVNKDVNEYGYPPFGTDQRYGLRTVTWINEHYVSVRVIRQDAKSDAEGMRLFRRRS
jgi:hypothetical protein